MLVLETMRMGIIFDLDGTLWDTRFSVIDLWNKVFLEQNLKKDVSIADLTPLIGLPLEEICQNLLPDLNKKQIIELVTILSAKEISHLENHGGCLYPEVHHILTQLKSLNIPLYIVSNCQAGYIEAFLNYYKFNSLFADFESAGRSGLSKKDNIKNIIERNNLSQAVYIGDTINDCISAQGAGVPFIWAAYGFGKDVKAEYRLGSIEELLPLLMDNFL